ncbi:MAG TPA: CBS domain-containing protein [Aggregatilineales bacterium]|nr:CBS domain-containing protein [Aggregatilineales bacterium]
MKTCGQVMTRDPRSCLGNESAQQAAQTMKREDVGSIPVVQDQQSKHLIGIVTDRDLAVNVVAEARDPRSTRVQDVMTSHPVTCHETDDLNKAMDAMAQHQVRRIPIVDNNNRLVGIVSQADVATQSNAPKKTAEVIEKISQSEKPAMH